MSTSALPKNKLFLYKLRILYLTIIGFLVKYYKRLIILEAKDTIVKNNMRYYCKKYKTFGITTKVVEHCEHTD